MPSCRPPRPVGPKTRELPVVAAVAEGVPGDAVPGGIVTGGVSGGPLGRANPGDEVGPGRPAPLSDGAAMQPAAAPAAASATATAPRRSGKEDIGGIVLQRSEPRQA